METPTWPPSRSSTSCRLLIFALKLLPCLLVLRADWLRRCKIAKCKYKMRLVMELIKLCMLLVHHLLRHKHLNINIFRSLSMRDVVAGN